MPKSYPKAITPVIGIIIRTDPDIINAFCTTNLTSYVLPKLFTIFGKL